MLNITYQLTSHLLKCSGALACLAIVLLLINVFIDVVMRYAFNDVSIGMQELEWHLFAVAFMLGIPYTMLHDGHVRVDLFYEQTGDRLRAWVNLLGACIFIIPFALVVTIYGFSFVIESFDLGESSGDPGGLPYRWIIKSLIPLLGFLLIVGALNMMSYAMMVLSGKVSYGERDKGCPT